MNEQTIRLLETLDDELERKCCELRLQRRERALQTLFYATCALFVVLPVFFILAGVNLVTLFVPAAIFFSVALVALLPVILRDEPGGVPQ